MANAFNQKRDQAKLANLQDDCKALIERVGAAGRHRAIEEYVRQASVTKGQAVRALGLHERTT